VLGALSRFKRQKISKEYVPFERTNFQNMFLPLQFVQQDLAHNEAGPILPLDARHSRLQSSTE